MSTFSDKVSQTFYVVCEDECFKNGNSTFNGVCMKVVTVVGARPQFIKAATVSRALRGTAGIQELLIHTGQHYDDNMSSVFFRELDIPQPEFSLNIGSSSHGMQTGRMLEAIEKILVAEKPDRVLVYGDTNSTLAGALAASKLHIPIAHVEAGLRSFNKKMPEEINRILTDHVSDQLFAPTQAAVENLGREGLAGKTVLTGDVMYDGALLYGKKAEAESRVLENLGVKPGSYILATFHRAENTDDPVRLRAIIDALYAMSQHLPVVLPLHPRTRGKLKSSGSPELNGRGNFYLTEPVGYLDMILLEKKARLVVTDSGGVQKEAFFHRVPCVTLRDETEWIELVELGWNRLVSPTVAAAIQDAIKASLLAPMGQTPSADLYGGGKAVERIIQHLSH